MALECCQKCKKWSEKESMYKSKIKRYKRLEEAYFCNVEHAMTYHALRNPKISNLNKTIGYSRKYY